MKKVFLFLFPILLAILVFFAFQFFLSRNSDKGALQVTSTPESNVYLNGNFIGKTPLCKCEGQDMFLIGEYSLRVVPKEKGFFPYEERVSIGKSVLAVVDRTFGNGAISHGSVITLERLDNKNDVEIFVASFPDKAEVFLDGSKKGQTPLLLKDVTESEHEIKLEKSGYKGKVVRIKTTRGFQLKAVITLAVSFKSGSPTPMLQEEKQASPSATQAVLRKVKILKTPTGFLRVRQEANISSLEIERVFPQESYELMDEKEGWYQIKLKNGKYGWVSSEYAQKE